MDKSTVCLFLSDSHCSGVYRLPGITFRLMIGVMRIFNVCPKTDE